MATKPDVERLLTIAEAAELTGYGEEVIDQWRARGLPFIAAGVGRLKAYRDKARKLEARAKRSGR